MKVSGKLLGVLMDLGILSAGGGHFKTSDTILNGVHSVFPEHEWPMLGLTILKMSMGLPEEAAQIISEKVLPLNPDSQVAKTFLGLYLLMANDKVEGQKILQEIVANGTDSDHVQLAIELLGFVKDRGMINDNLYTK